MPVNVDFTGERDNWVCGWAGKPEVWTDVVFSLYQVADELYFQLERELHTPKVEVAGDIPLEALRTPRWRG